jgi:hypothetical protein
MALAGTLCTTLLAATGITNKSLRALMTGLLAAPYSAGQMTYDLRRLRLTGLISRIEHTNRYVLTPDGIAFAVFYTKVHKTGCSVPCSPLASPRRPPNSGTRYVPSTSTSTTTSAAPASGKPRENLTQTSRS